MVCHLQERGRTGGVKMPKMPRSPVFSCFNISAHCMQFGTTLASTTRSNMGRNQGSSRQRVPRPDLKKRRPPVACIPCYRRKVKCGREVPVCRRCVQSGHEHECHYRNSSPANLPQSSLPEPGDAVPVALSRHVEGPQPDGRDQSAQAFAQETGGPPQTISSRGMIHFKGRATSTRFYGFSYHLNLYQRV